jgi:predicted heme/steroid binding protein
MAGEPRLARSSVVLHNNDRAGYWIAVDGVVYDVTTLRRIHPGGVHILDAHAGTDATAAFHRIGHHRSQRVTALARRYRIGVLDPLPHLHRPDRELYQSWIRAAYLVAEMENALRIDHGLRPPEGSVTPLALRYMSEVHERFVTNYLDAVTGDITDGLWRRTIAAYRSTDDPQWLGQQMSRVRLSRDHAAVVAAAGNLAVDLRALAAANGPTADLIAQRLDARCGLLERVDTALLADVKQIVRTGAKLLERDDVHGTPDADLLAELRRIPGVVARYCRHTAVLLQAR